VLGISLARIDIANKATDLGSKEESLLVGTPTPSYLPNMILSDGTFSQDEPESRLRMPQMQH